MPRPRKNPLFELAGQWIAAEPGRTGLWRFWYDAGAQKVRRARLRSLDLEEAKLELARAILEAAPTLDNDPPLAVVLAAYHEQRTDLLPSKAPARAASRLVLAFVGTGALVSELTEAEAATFAKAEVVRGSSHAYVSRTLSVVAAALAFGKFAPIPYSMKWLRQVAPTAKAARKLAIPSDDEIRRLLSAPIAEPLFRWMLISLATGARPEAALDFAPAQRRDGLLDLNPANRAQNKKHRPVVREPDFVAPHFRAWNDDSATLTIYGRYVAYASVDSVQTALERLGKPVEEGGLGIKISAYSFRHKVTTVLRRAKRKGVTEDDIAMQLGHKRPHLRTTGGYGEFDPDYLAAPAEALSAWLESLGFSRSIPAADRERDPATGHFLRKSKA
ncbi:MAG: hypothetical protein IT548_06915 [Alphaproteobacteria bacterium]|nr:hypothetical protein [Alphaproteobacteria bacterium]